MHAYRDQYAQSFNGGRGVVLIAVSTDSIGALESWARDDEFPFVMGSDLDGAVGKAYGVSIQRPNAVFDNRAVFVIGPDGKITYRAVPFREIDPAAYSDLADAVAATLPAEAEG